MYKAKNNLTPNFMELICPKRNKPYNLRFHNPFTSRNVKSVHNGTETLSFQGHKIWEKVPDEIKKSTSIFEFKAKIKHWKPVDCECRICKIYIGGLGFIE